MRSRARGQNSDGVEQQAQTNHRVPVFRSKNASESLLDISAFLLSSICLLRPRGRIFLNASLIVCGTPMRVLCVAEKPSISKSITSILSGGQFTTVITRHFSEGRVWTHSFHQHNTQNKYIKNYEFDYPQTRSTFTVTAVLGHLTTNDFTEAHRGWNSCDPFDLSDATVATMIPKDMKSIEQNLMTQARRCDTLMIWTDCDREGEHIGMEIVRVCRKAKPNIQVKRARFSAIIAQYVVTFYQHV